MFLSSKFSILSVNHASQSHIVFFLNGREPKRFTNVNMSYSWEVHVCGFVKCSDLVAPHELCTETGKPAKESEMCEAVFS